MNVSTLFGPSNSAVTDRLTVLLVCQTDTGSACVTYGDDPDFFASDCSTTW